MEARGRLVSRVAVVTGAAQGIGAAIAARLVVDGAHVVVADTARDGGHAVAESLGDGALFVPLDVCSAKDWTNAVGVATDHFGVAPTIVVHNAGVMVPGTAECPDESALRRAFDVNLLGPVLGTATCVPGMKALGGGSIVVMSSIAAVTGGAGFVPYAVSKSANVTYARCAAKELGPYGIRVNALLAGGVETPMSTGPNFASLDRDAWFGSMAIPRIGRPDEIAAAVAYLVSDESSFVTGTTLVVDGGQVLGPIARAAVVATPTNG